MYSYSSNGFSNPQAFIGQIGRLNYREMTEVGHDELGEKMALFYEVFGKVNDCLVR